MNREKKLNKLTHSEFYKMRRPEYFSDSEISYEIQLPKEQLAFELSQISKNQKQDEFETLARRLAEKFIVPNLIPQVGPTGGGDGKTDSETYPVSVDISDRWFIPENGWEKDEKWAFAISSKTDWKTKANGDIKKILETKRDYTKIYFITNQTPSSKKKKDFQDQIIKKHNIDFIILDGEWILEKIYGSKLFDLAVDSLNLSDVFKAKKTLLGQNDTYRIKKLNELEEKIKNPNRYFQVDYQLVEDTLESAILSRMVEKPREEIEGKFDRAIRFCKKLDYAKQWIRLHYQRAWTYINWYDDYALFIQEYKNLKTFISHESTISEIELYLNLFNLLRGLAFTDKFDLSKHQIDFQDEKEKLYEILGNFGKKKLKPCSSLIAKTYKVFQELLDSIVENEPSETNLKKLSSYISESKDYIDFPFESIIKMIEEIGNSFANNTAFDDLIDKIASISEKRTSELSSGELFLKRGKQKLLAQRYKDSIIYFGKAVLKLAKEETHNGMFHSLIGLSQAYSSLGLIWASNNCLISASSLAFKSWYESGIINGQVYYCVKQLLINELFIGRVPIILNWHELFQIILRQFEINNDPNEVPDYELMDACLAVRILNTKSDNDVYLKYLPDILNNQTLWLSEDASLYKLGYISDIIKNYRKIDIKTAEDLDSYFKMVASQPFVSQMLYETDFLYSDELSLSSIILGCNFKLYFEKDIELVLIAEMLLALLEGFFATSLKDVIPNTENIAIYIVKNPDVNNISFFEKELTNEYCVEINKFLFSKETSDSIWSSIINLIGHILANNYIINDAKLQIENLFKNEEVHERLSLVLEHCNFVSNILGEKPKLFFKDWITNKSIIEYPTKRKTPVSFSHNKDGEQFDRSVPFDPDNVGHNKRKVFSIIDNKLWDKAKWKGFGLLSNSFQLIIFLPFENAEAGKEIFDNWIKRVGNEDTQELIRITIIKGVDEKNPHWYRVRISSNVDEKSLNPGDIFITASRIHKMNPVSSDNLNNLLRFFNTFKKYVLCPAKMTTNGNFQPYFEKGILKRSLFVKEAWEIGEHDLDSLAIKKGDKPIIPDGITDAPVLKVLKMKY